MTETMIPTGWIRGVLDPCLLALLADGEAYGYELAGLLGDAGFGRIPGGSLYPALLRLEKQELLVADWRAGDGGPGRKYYSLTPAGRAVLRDHLALWDHFSSTVSSVLAAGAES